MTLPKARATATPDISIGPSNIKGAGEGLFAGCEIPANVALGHYKGVTRTEKDLGEIIRTEKKALGHSPTEAYAFALGDGTFVDAALEKGTSYTRFINEAPTVDERNCTPRNLRGKVYFITTKLIESGKEILTYYGNQYGRDYTIEEI